MLPKPILAAMVALTLLTAACKMTSQVTSQSEQLPESVQESVQVSGEEIYQSMGCPECHEMAAGVAAPPLDDLYGGMVTLESGETILADETYLRESIVSPNARIVQGYKPIMPDFRSRISDEQVEALIEYIRYLAK